MWGFSTKPKTPRSAQNTYTKFRTITMATKRLTIKAQVMSEVVESPLLSNFYKIAAKNNQRKKLFLPGEVKFWARTDPEPHFSVGHWRRNSIETKSRAVIVLVFFRRPQQTELQSDQMISMKSRRSRGVAN